MLSEIKLVPRGLTMGMDFSGTWGPNVGISSDLENPGPVE